MYIHTVYIILLLFFKNKYAFFLKLNMCLENGILQKPI